ncbi:MAG: c-type cytochrome [Blastocatellia bacterium]
MIHMLQRRFISLVTSVVFATGFCLTAANNRTPALDSATTPAQQKTAGEEKAAEQVYKNIQVLNGLPASELDGVMYFMSASLGVACTHCHTNPWDSDAKSAKLAARRMIAMTRDLNKESFSRNPAITCYTCHRGQHNTEPLPPIDIATNPARDVTVPTAKPSALPPTEEIIERYIRAIGGETAIGKLKTRISRGAETTTNRMTPPQTLPIEIVQAAPNKLLITRDNPGAASAEGFDGLRGWTRDARGQREMTGKELAVSKREADFFRYLKIRESYPQMRVLAKEKVGDREAYVAGVTSREDDREKLYFDVDSGLLIRKYVAFKTAFGSIPDVTDFEDYREVGGVKLPFTIKWSRPPFGFVRRFTEISINPVVDDARFQPR